MYQKMIRHFGVFISIALSISCLQTANANILQTGLHAAYHDEIYRVSLALNRCKSSCDDERIALLLNSDFLSSTLIKTHHENFVSFFSVEVWTVFLVHQ